MTPVMQAASDFALRRRHRVHRPRGVPEHSPAPRCTPCLLLCISAISFSWIEAPYDWAMYAQFPPAIPRMPSWWPLNMTWGGLPLSVPVGYISYFVLPAVTGAALGRWLSARFGWRRPITLLIVGLVVGFCWALFFNGFLGAQLGVFYYGRVIPGLAIFEGTKHQYPLYDALAMGVQMMVFTYLLGPHRCRRPKRHRDVGRLEAIQEPASVIDIAVVVAELWAHVDRQRAHRRLGLCRRAALSQLSSGRLSSARWLRLGSGTSWTNTADAEKHLVH